MVDKNEKNIAKKKALEAALINIKKNFGEGCTRKGSDLDVVETIRTGHDDLDNALVKDGFGVARGRIIELSGKEGDGKSSVALRICCYAQKAGLVPFWIDLERALVPGGIAEINGVDMNNIIIPDLIDTNVTKDTDGETPFNAGRILDMMEEAISSGQFNPVVLDSVAGLVPEREMQAETFNKEHMMETPRLLSKALRKISQIAEVKNVCVIFINQERDKPNPTGQTLSITPGGRALKFFASQRLRISRIGGITGQIKKDEEDGSQRIIGHWARVKIVKNRCAPPCFEPIEIPIYYEPHFPDEAERLYDAARSLQVITSRSGVITWKSGDETVFRVDGTSSALSKIRDSKLLPRLAYECLQAEKSEKNTKKKNPYKMPQVLAELAESYKTD